MPSETQVNDFCVIVSLSEKIVRRVCLYLGFFFLYSQPGLTIVYAQKILPRRKLSLENKRTTSSHSE